MTKKSKYLNFLNNGLGARLILGRVYRFLHIDGTTIFGKLIGINGNEATVQDNGEKRKTTLFRTTQVKNETPSKKVGGSKKGKK